MKETCENCRYVHIDPCKSMCCKRFPPKTKTHTHSVVTRNQWCGEWREIVATEPSITPARQVNPWPECLCKTPEDVAAEKCDCCGQVGPDRCWLAMSCGIPMTDADDPPTKYSVPFQRPYGNDWEGTDSPYTLRVCKSCRADWLKAIGSWFTFMVMPDRSSVDQQFTQLRQTLERANVDLDTLRRRCVDKQEEDS